MVFHRRIYFSVGSRREDIDPFFDDAILTCHCSNFCGGKGETMFLRAIASGGITQSENIGNIHPVRCLLILIGRSESPLVLVF
jgi:hypothetical protein